MNDDIDSALYEPAVILPVQTSTGAWWTSDTSGPIALMRAVLEDAVHCFERGRRNRHPRARMLASEAEAWVLSDGREWAFAFANVCDARDCRRRAGRTGSKCRRARPLLPGQPGLLVGDRPVAIVDEARALEGTAVQRVSNRGEQLDRRDAPVASVRRSSRSSPAHWSKSWLVDVGSDGLAEGTKKASLSARAVRGLTETHASSTSDF